MKKKKRKLGYLGCGIMLLAITTAGCGWMTTFSFVLNTTDRSSYESVARTFAVGLMENRDVESLVIPELWPFLDQWNEDHKVFSCPSFHLFAEDFGYSTNEPVEEEENTKSYTVVHDIYCPDSSNRYFIQIKGIKLKRFGEEWKVIEWGEVCEIINGVNKCENP